MGAVVNGPGSSRQSSSRQSSGRQSPGAENAPAKRPLGEVRFLTVAEVAEAMRVSKMTVYRLVHGGDLPAVRVGRSYRVPEQAVQDYLAAAYVDVDTA